MRGRLGSVIREVVAKRLPLNDKLKNSWRHIMPLFIDVTIETVYPFNIANKVVLLW